MITILTLLGLVLAYLLGSFPTGVWISKTFFKIDLRDFGSGNTGATNTFRVLGRRAGAIVMIIDILKGFTAVKLANLLGNYPIGSEQFVNFQLSLGITAVFGHLFPIYIGFKGGKGVATLLGMIFAIHHQSALICSGVFVLALILTSYVSLSSIIASLVLPILIIFVFDSDVESLQVFGIAIALLVIFTHQQNIKRLLKGKESKARIFRRKK